MISDQMPEANTRLRMNSPVSSAKSKNKRCTTLNLEELETVYWKFKSPQSVGPVEDKFSPYKTSSTDHSIDEIPQVRYSRFFIERDYSEVLHPRFKTQMPYQLTEMLIEERVWARTIKEINEILDEASKLSRRTAFETTSSFLTCYLINITRETYYQKCMKRLGYYIRYQNHTEYRRKGLKIVDPCVNGLRNIKFIVLDQEFITARFDEDMLSRKLNPDGTFKTTDVPAEPQAGTSSFFGIPAIAPKDEPPPGPEASRGIHEMRFVVPPLPQSEVPPEPELDLEDQESKVPALSQMPGTSASFGIRYGRLPMVPAPQEARPRRTFLQSVVQIVNPDPEPDL